MKILYDTVMMDTCRHIFVQTHRMYTTKGKPYIELWTLGNIDVSLEVH